MQWSVFKTFYIFCIFSLHSNLISYFHTNFMEALISDDTISHLNKLQQKLFRKDIPVLIIFEGSSGRVIGRVMNEIMRCLEPRGVSYHHFDPSKLTDPYSALDFLQKSPRNGRIALFDRSWYSAIIERYNEDDKEKELEMMLDQSIEFEKYLVQNGVFLVKVFLKGSESVIKEHGSSYWPDGPKRSFLSMDHIDPAKYREVMVEKVYKRTDTKDCPWDIVSVKSVEETVSETSKVIIQRLEQRINGEPVFVSTEMRRDLPNPRKGLDLDKECNHYDDMIRDLSDELSELQMTLSTTNHSMVICFEGWDAAGKGSCIKHLCHALNPRGYIVHQTKTPTEYELAHTYLWRFCRDMPRNGHIAIFDRTWYGRMMVEHVEGLCTEDEYNRAPHEIEMFERTITENGTVLLKFWLDITPEEQLKRFKKREDDPLKKWKITDEDWRNREKWDEYDAHVDIVMESTNLPFAPWTIIESNSKKYARVKVLKTVVDALKKELEK